MMYKKKEEPKTLLFSIITIFVLLYPMLISIYVFLPLFIGAISFMLVKGIEEKKVIYIVLSVIFLINLEVNLSLPLFLTLISALIFYLLMYASLSHLRSCKICTPLLSVILLDFLYLGALFAFDFIFQVESIQLDTILLYSLVVDMLIVVLL